MAGEIATDFARHLNWPAAASDITGVGFGLRAGKVRPALIVQERVRPTARKPRRQIPDRFAGFDVLREVERVEDASLAIDKIRRAFGCKPQVAWPLWPGSFVRANGLRKAGTLGCYVQCRSVRNWCAVTCEHVLSTNSGPPSHGTPVNSYVSGKKSSETLLGQVVIVRPNAADLDSVLVEAGPGIRGVNVIPQIGRLSPTIFPFHKVPLGSMVCKYGAASGFSVGVVTAVQNVRQMRDDNVAVVLRGVVEITPDFNGDARWTSFCAQGDSGAIVTLHTPDRADDVHAVGLLVARATLLDRGYCVPLDRIASTFDFSLA